MKHTISHTQLTALLWLAALAPAAELLPTLTLPLAGRGAWLGTVAAIPLVLLGGWLLRRPLPRPLFIIYVCWGEVLLGLRLRLLAQRLSDGGPRDGTVWFFLVTAAAMALWMALGELDAFARAGQLYLVPLLLAAGGVLLLSLGGGEPAYTLPRLQEVPTIIYSGLPTAGVLGWSLYGTFLTGRVRPGQGNRGWHWGLWGAGGCLLLAMAQWITLANLGPALAARLDSPFFALVKAAGVEGAFQRVESVITTLWALADLALAVLLLFGLGELLYRVAPRLPRRRGTVGAVLLGVVLAITLFAGGRSALWNRAIVPWGNLVLGLVLPAILHFVPRKRENRKI